MSRMVDYAAGVPDLKKLLLAGLGLALLIAAAAAFVLYRPAPAPPGSVRLLPVPPAAPAPPRPPVADCLRPGPAPVPPQGATANADEMKLGHDSIQHFVEQLEAFQACRNAQIDHAAPAVTDKQKQAWLDDGNSAVDEANALAGAYSTQIKRFKARSQGEAHPGAPAVPPGR